MPISNPQQYVYTSTDYSTWTRQDRLRAMSYNLTTSANSSATFSMEARHRVSSAGVAADTFIPSVGLAISICPVSTGYDPAQAVWTGLIETIETTPIRNVSDELGSITAIGFGAELKRRRVEQVREKDISSSAVASGVPLESPPTFNLKTNRGQLIGNAVAGETVGGIAYKQLATRTSDLSTFWTRKDVVKHIIHYCWAASLPPVILVDTLTNSPLDDTTALDAWDLGQLPLQEALDILISETIGVSWMMVYDTSSSKWSIRVVPISEQITGVSAITATITNRDSSLSLKTLPLYDAVEVEGGRIVAGGSMSCQQQGGSVAPAWASTLATDFVQNAPSADDVEINRAYRNQPQFRDVFTRYEAQAYTPTYDFFCKGSAGSDWSGVKAFCNEILWDGTTASIGTNLTTPNIATASILDWFPWYSGVKVDGTDNRTADQKKQPQTLGIGVFTNPQDDGTGSPGWRDLLNPPNDAHHRPSVSVEANSPSVIVRYPFPEVMALNHWDDSTAKPSQRAPTHTETYEASDYHNLVITLAMETDQHLRITKTRSGVSNVGRKLTLNRPDFQCWYVKAYSVLGVGDDVPIETTADQIIRDDWKYAEALAQQAATWAFRSRTEMTLTLQGYTLPTWAVVGNIVGTLVEQALVGGVWTTVNTYTLNTIIKSISVSLDPANPSITISTEAPQFISKAVAGLGASLPVAVSRLAGRTTDLEQALNRAKEAGDSGSGNPPNVIEWVSLPSHGFSVGQVLVNASGTWTLAQANNANCDKQLGIVVRVLSPNSFMLCKWGYCYLQGSESILGRGTYYVSPTAAGGYTEEVGLATTDYKRAIFEYHGGGVIMVLGPRLAGAHQHSLADLHDADTTTTPPNSKSILAWNVGTSKWIPQAFTSFIPSLTGNKLGDLGDVKLTTLAGGNLIQYNGSKWVNYIPGTHSVGPGISGNSYNTNGNSVWGLDVGFTDNRYYTQAALQAGALNSIYYTKPQVDAAISSAVPTLQALTAGTGLTGTPAATYDGTTATEFDLAFAATGGHNGSSNQPARLDHTHATFTATVDGFVPKPTTATGTKVLCDDGTWKDGVNPMTTSGDIIVGGTAGVLTRVPVNAGGSSQVLQSKSGITQFSSAVLNILNDVDTTGATDGQVMTYNNATSKWKPANATGSGYGTNPCFCGLIGSKVSGNTYNCSVYPLGPSGGTTWSTTVVQLQGDSTKTIPSGTSCLVAGILISGHTGTAATDYTYYVQVPIWA